MNRQVIYIFLIICALVACNKESEHFESFNSFEENKWKILTSNNSNDINDIYILNDSLFFICGSFGKLESSLNDGQSWISHNTGFLHSFNFVQVLSTNTIFTGRINLLQSTDGGNNFNSVYQNGNSSIKAVHFYNSSEGLLLQGSSIFQTKDSSRNWTNIFDSHSYPNLLVCSEDSLILLAGGRTYDNISSGELYQSLDKGKSWRMINLPNAVASSQITALDIYSSNHLWMGTFNGNFYYSSDAGSNWVQIASFTDQLIIDLKAITNNQIVLITSNKIYLSENGGQSWRLDYQDLNNTFNAIEATSDGTVFIVGNKGKIYRNKPFNN